MNLYAEFMKEVCGTECVHDENSFYTYVMDDEMVYLQNVYVCKEKRGSGRVEEIVEEVYEIGKKNGCKSMTSSVCKNSFSEIQERSEHILNKLEFEKYDENENMIFYFKEIV